MKCHHDHAQLKRDPNAWAQLPLVGHQPVEPSDDEPGYTLELRNCTSCHTTLAREVQS